MEDDITVLIPVVFRIFFNSHPHKEDDSENDGIYQLTPLFNSHPHMEDDGISQMWWIKHNLFNSHPHKEDDATIRCM